MILCAAMSLAGHDIAWLVLQKYRSAGFNLIGFPCNQFGGQAPKYSDGEREAAFYKFGFEFPIMVSRACSQSRRYPAPKQTVCVCTMARVLL